MTRNPFTVPSAVLTVPNVPYYYRSVTLDVRVGLRKNKPKWPQTVVR